MKIQVEKLKKIYNEKTVLDVESLALDEGKLYGIIGVNGAGKSTLIKLIADVEDKTMGNIKYTEAMVERVPVKQMTLVFQKPTLIRTTVENNIRYPMKIRNWPKEKIESRLEELLDAFDLQEIRKQKSNELSGGEMQKVALARGLSFYPKILLLDEPTANIDPSTIAIMEKMIKKACYEQGATTLIVTHNLLQAKRLCSDLIFINNGKVIEEGISEEIFASPKQEITQRFLNGELLI